MSTLSVLDPAIVPAARETRKVTLASGDTITVEIVTRKLPGAPYHEYTARCNGEILLQYISKPSDYDLEFAYTRQVNGGRHDNWQTPPKKKGAQ